MKQLMLLMSLIFVSACQSSGFNLGSKTPAPVVDAPFKSWPNQSWASEALATVRREGLAKLTMSDAGLFCPKGMSERNWVHLMAAVVYYESGFKPTTVYNEPPPLNVPSSGLFQMTKSTDNPNYGCNFTSEKDVQDPVKNIQCAGKAIKKLVARDGAITNHTGTSYKGMAKYWSVMRPLRKLPQVKAKLKPWCE